MNPCTQRWPHLLLAWLLLGCGGESSTSTSARDAGAFALRVDDPDAVVARVNHAPILRRDLLQQMRDICAVDRSDPQCTTPQSALQSLVQQELLVQEAIHRGLSTRDEVTRARRRALANLMIRTGFHYTKQDIPQHLLRSAYELNKLHFVRPDLVRVSQIIVHADRNHRDDFRHRALGVARQIRDIAASGPLSDNEFRQIAPMMAKKHKEMTIQAQARTITRHGRTVEIFAKAAFALHRPGEISPVVVTRFGYHVIYLIERYPALNVPFEQAIPTLRDRVFDEARRMAFSDWLERLRKSRGVSP